MDKLLTFIEKDRADKSSTVSSVTEATTSQGTSQDLKPALRNIVGKANNDMRQK